MSELDRFDAEMNIHFHGQWSGKAPRNVSAKFKDGLSRFSGQKNDQRPNESGGGSGLPAVDHFRQSLFHVQTQLQSTLMDEFKICSGISHRQREHDGPSLVEIVAQCSQIGEKRLA